MQIRKAMPEEFERVRQFYYDLIDAMQESEYHPEWKKDVYPAPEELRRAIQAETLYTGLVDDGIVAAMVVNQSCNEEYQDVAWALRLKQDEFMVVHMLGVHPVFSGRGYASEMVQFALDVARTAGMKAVRLDVLEGNLPAEELYLHAGFSYRSTIQLYYEDTGWKNFKLYEYIL